jgi:hypothetical protein
MEILISFSTSVGVVTASKIAKDIAVDVVNHSIVLSLKNIKTPHPAKPGENLNNRSINYTTPPDSYYSGFVKLLRVNEYRTDYYYYEYSPGKPYRTIEIDVDTTPIPPSSTGFKKVRVTDYYDTGNVITEYEEPAWNPILRYGVCGASAWSPCVYNSSYFKSFYSASVKYLVLPL